MVEADHSIFRHTPLTIAQRQRMAIMTLAMQAARGVVKNELKRQGRRLADVEAKEITIAARAMLDQPFYRNFDDNNVKYLLTKGCRGRWGRLSSFPGIDGCKTEPQQ
jgi:hypothetical protein